MIEVRETLEFSAWLDSLRDKRGRARIMVRIERLAMGNPGDTRGIGAGVSELRIDTGPGYRVYYKKLGQLLIILLAGGDKSSQRSDIRRALDLARDV